MPDSKPFSGWDKAKSAWNYAFGDTPDYGTIDVPREQKGILKAQRKRMRDEGARVNAEESGNRLLRDQALRQAEEADRVNKGLQGPKTWGPEAARRGEFPDAHGHFRSRPTAKKRGKATARPKGKRR